MKFKHYLITLLTLIALCFSGNVKSNELDSLNNILDVSDDIKVRIETTIRIGQHYNQLAMDTAVVFFNDAIDMATRIGDRKLTAIASMSLASYYGYIAQKTDVGYAIACESRDLISYLSDTSELYVKYCGKAELYGGMLAIDQGNYTKAQGHFFDALEFFEKIEDSRSALVAYNQLIFLYGTQEMLIEAEDILIKTILLCQENKWFYEEMIFLSNKGSIQYLQEKYAESIVSMKKSEQIIYTHLDTTDYYNLGLIYSCIGSNYYELENYDSSYFYHQKGLYCSHASQIPSEIISAYAGLAEDCVKRGDLNEARSHCHNMQIRLDSIQIPQLKVAGLIAWVSYYEAAGDYQAALEKTKALMELREESINEKNIREQTEQKMDFDFEKERLLSDTEIQLKNEKIKVEQAYNSNLTIGIWILAGLFLIVAFLFYSNFKQRSIISEKNDKLNQTIDEKETLLKEIHHRVKNNLQLISSLLGLQSQSLDDQQILSAFEEGQNRVQAMALIHQKLYQNDVSSEIDFQDYLQGLIGHFSDMNESNKKVDFEIDCEDIKLDIDTAIPLGLIINELFTNAYKHAFKNIELPKLSVSIKNEGSGEYSLKMTDNGIGLPKDLDWAKTKSLGLRLIRSLVKQLIGKIDYEHHPNLSVFSIRFKNQLGRNLID